MTRSISLPVRWLAGLFGLCALPGALHAQEEQEDLQPDVSEETGAEPAVEHAGEALPALTISGFVDASFFLPLSGYGAGDLDPLLGLDQAEIDFIADVSPGLLVRADINIFPARGEAFDDRLLEQGFIDYLFGGGDTGAFISAGKRNAPIGIESIDPVDEYQFSAGQLFSFATPSNLTGFFGGYRGSLISAMVWVTNDWDTPSTPDNTLVGGRVSFDQEAGHVGVSSTYGPISADGLAQLMVDLDAAWGFGDLTLMAEGNFGTREADEAAGETEDPTSIGALFKAHYAFTDRLGGTVRFDWLDREYGTVVNNMSITGAFLFGITEGFGGLVEIRADLPDEGDTLVSSALELTAAF